MGSSNWSDQAYASRAAYAKSTNTPVFKHDHDIKTGKKAAGVEKSLDPKGIKVRESRDSAAHPNSVAVAVFLDVTGSMYKVPQMIQVKLPQLMGLLTRKGYLADPHIMIGAVGDAYTDQVPLQVGQFEAGIEIDNDISNIYMEGNGGGQNKESYDLAMHLLAYHTSIDCLEKRDKKGYAFIIGDEQPYPYVNPSQVQWGEQPQDRIPLKKLVEDLTEKYEVFFINPNMTMNYGRADLRSTWEELLPERFLQLDDPNGICELIASTIGLMEGFDSVGQDLKDAGTDLAVVDSVSRAVSKVKAGDRGLSVPVSSRESGLA